MRDPIIERTFKLLDARLDGFESILAGLSDKHDNGINNWNGHERRADAAFSDEQVRRIKEIFDERAEVHAGRIAFRAILWAIGAAAAGAATAAIAWLGFKR